MNKLLTEFGYTTFILVVTDDNEVDKYFLSDTYEKCYQYMLSEYFDNDEEYLKESESNEKDTWYDEENCWLFKIEQAKTI